MWSNTWKSFKFEYAGDSDGWVIYNCTRISPWMALIKNCSWNVDEILKWVYWKDCKCLDLQLEDIDKIMRICFKDKELCNYSKNFGLFCSKGGKVTLATLID